MIFTFNVLDFPFECLAPHGVAARHPDEWFCEILDAAAVDFCAGARGQRLALKTPPMTIEQFLAKLEQVGLPLTAARLRACAVTWAAGPRAERTLTKGRAHINVGI